MSDIPWTVEYDPDTGRGALAVATPAERAAIISFEQQLAQAPHHCGDFYPDAVGGLYTALLTVEGRPAWTSVLYRVDDDARTVLIVGIVSGP
ncbi:hypothetical protein [Streptomyces klenkii]